MTVQADPQRADAFYDEFYRDGGWEYSRRRELRWHRRHFVKRFNLKRGVRILEVGCGAGFHTHLLNTMGFDCIGVDRSHTGIEWARDHYPDSTYHCCDIDEMPVEQNSFDVVLARGLSHYHYDLMNRQALQTTANLLRYLKPGGLFVLAIATDLSGRCEPEKIWQNTLEDYRKHFSFFGSDWTVDWHKGMAICGVRREEATASNDADAEKLSFEPALTR